MVLIRVEITHMSKFKPGTVEKTSSAIVYICDAGAMLLPLSYGGS